MLNLGKIVDNQAKEYYVSTINQNDVEEYHNAFDQDVSVTDDCIAEATNT
jgi:hypothetical protein